MFTTRLQQAVLLVTCVAQRCLNTNPYSVGMEGKVTLELSYPNNDALGTDWGVVSIANTILLLSDSRVRGLRAENESFATSQRFAKGLKFRVLLFWGVSL